ncbi:MAG: metallophosphoesterase family protein, partial [Flavobacteriia bacterium]|nr:metallophosphoesterase family protein [Flavobacteriia bacterium]
MKKHWKQGVIIFCGIFISLIVNSQTAIIPFGSTWKYWDQGTNPGNDWMNASFSDQTWNSGSGEFGYGDGDETTIINFGSNTASKYITTYFRKTFHVSNPSQFFNFSLSLKRDDGLVVYLNGIEIYRNNMPISVIDNATLASTAISSTDESMPHDTLLLPVLFQNGNNVLAVEVHQSSATSSDLTFDLSLEGNINPPFSISQIRWGSANNPLVGVAVTWKGKGTADKIKWGYAIDLEMGEFTAGSRSGYEDYFNDYTFPNLNPDTTLYYKLYDSYSMLWSDVKLFKTSKPIVTTSFSFTALGDSRSGVSVWNQVSELAQSKKTDLTLFNGDIVADGGSVSDWNNWFDFAKTFVENNIIYHALGNHDASSVPDYQNNFELPVSPINTGTTNLFYSFNYGNALFICLNSEDPSNLVQYNWLLNTLQENQDKTWKVVFFHRPFYTIGNHAGEMDNYYNTWWKAFDDYGVDLILTGHDHMYERSKPINRNVSTTTPVLTYGSGPDQGRCQIVCGGAGAPLYTAAPSWFVETYQSSYNFCKFNVNENQLCDSTFDVNGNLIETFCIEKSNQS